MLRAHGVTSAWILLWAALIVLTTTAGCQHGSDDLPRHAEIVAREQRPATWPDSFLLGQEERLRSDRDPGLVLLTDVESGSTREVAGEGVMRAFFVVSSLVTLTWDGGGAATLAYDPLIVPEWSVPGFDYVFPARGVTVVPLDDLTKRGIIIEARPAFEDARYMLPRVEVMREEISSASGNMWKPELSVNRARLKLLNDPGNPYERGETYRAFVDLAYPFAKGMHLPVEIEFTPE